MFKMKDHWSTGNTKPLCLLSLLELVLNIHLKKETITVFTRNKLDPLHFKNEKLTELC